MQPQAKPVFQPSPGTLSPRPKMEGSVTMRTTPKPAPPAGAPPPHVAADPSRRHPPGQDSAA
eukprot:12937971-Alexandrium_andersonii.AAC.1